MHKIALAQTAISKIFAEFRDKDEVIIIYGTCSKSRRLYSYARRAVIERSNLFHTRPTISIQSINLFIHWLQKMNIGLNYTDRLSVCRKDHESWSCQSEPSLTHSGSINEPSCMESGSRFLPSINQSTNQKVP